MSARLGFLGRWGPALLMMLVIFRASATPGDDLPDFGLFDTVVKKAAHAVGYALLGLSYLRGLRGSSVRIQGRAALTAVGLAALYAATDEIHQIFTPHRHPAVTDVLIDTLGASLGVASRWLWARRGPHAGADL